MGRLRLAVGRGSVRRGQQRARKNQKEFDTSGKSRAYLYRRKNPKPAPRKQGAGFLSPTMALRITFVPPQFRSPVRPAINLGNGDEETACCNAGRRIAYFVRSESSKSCWRCCARRSVGSSGFRPGGRGGRCAHWIHRGTGDRTFLGSGAGAVRVAIAGSTRKAIQPANAATGGCEGDAVGTRQNSRSGRQQKQRAGGSGI
jgi:hypothetical protein